MRMRASFVFAAAGVAGGLALFFGCSSDDDAAVASGRDAAADASAPAIDAGAADSGMDAGPPIAPYGWVGVIGTGQSLSVGAQAQIVVSKEPSFHNGKLADDGPAPKYPLDGGGASYAIAPLVEPIRGRMEGYGDSQYPNNIYGETPHSGMASELSTLFTQHGGGDYVTMHSVVGWSGHALSDIDKRGGKRAYPGSIQEVRAFTALAKAQNVTYGVGGIILTHGETDALNGNLAYGAGLKTLVDDYNTDIKAITGQSADIPLLVSQQSTIAGPTSTAVQVWQAGLDDPRIVCVGPKYQYGYAADNLHFLAPSYLRLGEKYAEVFDIVVNQKKTWAPVQPKAITIANDKIVIAFTVPNPPLAWDETLAAPHQSVHTAWKNGRGFEVLAGSTELTITSADLTAADTVTLTMSAPVTAPVSVRYATTEDGDSGTYHGGLVSGFRGQLADSDPLIGYDEESLAVTLTQGSPTVMLGPGASLAARAVRDVVTIEGAPPLWTVTALGATALTMSADWPGPSGPATVKIHHDLRNYAVHFAKTVTP